MWREAGFAYLTAPIDKIWNYSEGGHVVVLHVQSGEVLFSMNFYYYLSLEMWRTRADVET